MFKQRTAPRRENMGERDLSVSRVKGVIDDRSRVVSRRLLWFCDDEDLSTKTKREKKERIIITNKHDATNLHHTRKTPFSLLLLILGHEPTHGLEFESMFFT